MFTVLAAVTLVLLLGVNRFEKRLDAQVAEHKLRFTGEIRNAPPMVIFTTVALGSFRGIVADLLWLRAGALQEKGNYFEMADFFRSNSLSCLEYGVQHICHLFRFCRPLALGQ